MKILKSVSLLGFIMLLQSCGSLHKDRMLEDDNTSIVGDDKNTTTQHQENNDTDTDIFTYIHQEYSNDESSFKIMFASEYKNTYKTFENSIDLFESHNNEGNYKYAVFLDYDYTSNGLTVGRIFTTRSSKSSFLDSDAYKVVKRLKLVSPDIQIVKLVDSYLNNEIYVNNYMPKMRYIKENYPTVPEDKDEYKVSEKYKNDSFISAFAYEWNQLENNEKFKQAQDILVFKDVYKRVLDVFKSIDGLALSKIWPLTFYVLADATVYHGAETPQRLKLGEVEGININDYDLNTIVGQKDFIDQLLKTELFHSSGQDHRRETLRELLNTKKYSFTYKDIKIAYDKL